MGENFLPRDDIQRVSYYEDGKVSRLLARCNGEDIPIAVSRNGWPDIPRFSVPREKITRMRSQMFAVISRCRQRAEREKRINNGVKKFDWASSLVKCGVNIINDGHLVVSRRQTNKQTGENTLVWMDVGEIDSAIRQAQYARNYYETELLAGPNNLLDRLHVIQPKLELRRLALIHARDLMRATLEEAYERYKRLARLVPVNGDQPDFQRLEERIRELIFLLTNQWANPYRDRVEAIKSWLERAKKSAARKDSGATSLALIETKVMLAAAVKEAKNGGYWLADIDPIKTLAEINRLNLANEVLDLAKLRIGGNTFRLDDMLIICREVIGWTGLVREQPAAPPPQPAPPLPRPAAVRPRGKRPKKRIVPPYQPAYEQGTLNLL